MTLVTLLRAYQDAALPECTIPRTKTSPRRRIAVLPKPHEVLRLCRRHPLGEAFGHLFRLQSPRVHLYSHCGTSVRPLCAQSGAKDAPRCPKDAKKEPKSSLLGAQRVTFGRQIGESGPLRKHQYGLCFHHIMRVRAPPFSLPKSTPERTVHRECSFSHFCLHFWRPSVPKAAPREP